HLLCTRRTSVINLLDCFHLFSLFFLHNPATTHIYTLSLHDALPISPSLAVRPSIYTPHSALHIPHCYDRPSHRVVAVGRRADRGDRKSTRLNSSHVSISYAVFCLKKKKI